VSGVAMHCSMIHCLDTLLQVCTGLVVVCNLLLLLVDLVRDAISSCKAEGH
jgi:hypothetical protein